MARYKRTARAEARRRHREQSRLEEVAAADAAAAGPEVEATGTAAAEKPRSALGSVLAGFTLPDVRADLRALPGVATRSWTFAAPLALAALAFLVGLDAKVFRGEETPGEPVTAIAARLFFQYMLNPVPVMPIFIAGFLAPRANWLAGGLVGALAAAGFFVLLGIHGPTVAYPGQVTPASALAETVSYLPIYLLLGGFSGWYRRWLTSRQGRVRQQAEERRRAQARDGRRRAATGRR